MKNPNLHHYKTIKEIDAISLCFDKITSCKNVEMLMMCDVNNYNGMYCKL